MRKTARWPVALSCAAIVALVVAAAAAAWSGAYAASVLVDPGVVVTRGLPMVIAASNIAVAVTLGGLVMSTFVLPMTRPRSARQRHAKPGDHGHSDESQAFDQPGAAALRRGLIVSACAAAAWTVLSAIRLVLQYLYTSGTAISDPGFGDQMMVYVTEIPQGRILAATIVFAAVATVVALLATSPVGAAVAGVIVIGPLIMQAVSGHASGQEGHNLAVSALLIHLVGAAVWIGGLVLIALVRRPLLDNGQLTTVLRRYSAIAAWCLVLVGASGIVSAALRVADWSDLGTRYGVLVIVKVVLLAGLGVLGLLHRLRVIGRLERDRASTRAAKWLLWRLIAVELAVMGAVSGVAAALGGTPPPVPDEPWVAPTPAQRITGYELPPEPTLARWFTEWRWDVLMATVVAAGLFVYLRWVIRLHRRGDGWPVLRTISWILGMITLLWVTCSGPATYGMVLFSAHMLQHMILAMVIPIFIVLSAPMTLALRALPSRNDGSRGPREWLLSIIHSRWGMFFANPIVAAVNFAGSMVVFYHTPLFSLALSTHIGHILMIVHFSLVGYMFANALIGIDPGPARPGHAQRLVLLFATMAFHAFFGMSIVESDRLMVAEWFGLLGRPWGPSAIIDQQRGGAITWGIGEIPTLILAVVVAITWSRDDERKAKARDRRVDQRGDTELDEYNARLQKLADRSK